MAISYGFYNSIAGDRKYDAEAISRVFDGLITDGIFLGYGKAFVVETDGTGMQVSVGTGRAWFNHTWTHNDTDEYYPITKPTAGTHKQIATIVIDVDLSKRENSIKVLYGEATSGTPVAPALTHGEGGSSYQYPLADILLSGAATVINQSDITNRRGLETDGTPFVTSILESVSVDDLLAQWKGSFDEWFEDIKETLTTNPTANVLSRVKAVEDGLSTLEDDVNGDGGLNERLEDVEYATGPHSNVQALNHNAITHRNIFRGKNLGTVITQSQIEEIECGDFTDIYIGDYWQYNGTNWRVADINYYAGASGPHILLIPDKPIVTDFMMNGSATTSGGYVGSGAYMEGEDDQMFNEYIRPGLPRLDSGGIATVAIKEYLVNKVDTDGRPIGGGWYTGLPFVLPSEVMVYGTRIWSYGNRGFADATDADHLFTCAPTQLALFRLAPTMIFCANRYWLRDTVSATRFAAVLEKGSTANRLAANSKAGLRPIIMIGG